MSKILRKNMKIFGSSAGANQIGKFGSLAAGSAQTVTDPEDVQQLSNYLTGWYGGIIGGNAPCIEDLNGLCFLFAYQLAYLMQTGIPEWNSLTTYYIGSMVNDGYGNIYISLTDNNIGNALTNHTHWKLPTGSIQNVVIDYTVLLNDEVIRVNNTGGVQITTLPDIATVPIGKKITVKRLSTSTYSVTVKGNGSQLVDDANIFILPGAKDSVTVQNNGAGYWDVI